MLVLGPDDNTGSAVAEVVQNCSIERGVRCEFLSLHRVPPVHTVVPPALLPYSWPRYSDSNNDKVGEQPMIMTAMMTY